VDNRQACLFQKTMDARHDSETKLTGERRRISTSHAETKQGYSAEEDRTLKQWGLNAETRMGGIEPMGEIFLLTFLPRNKLKIAPLR
jgi:hypothetical protein